jgi:thiol-disulfide isomerase/thioredoxin
MSRPRLVATAAALVFAVAACKEQLAPPRGDIAASLALPTADGTVFDPESLRGRPAILVFWRPGCQYCMREMPVVAKVARDKGAAAVAVMIVGSQDRARQLAAEFDGTVLIDDGSLRDRYDITKVPYTLVLRRDGTAARAFLGEQGESTLAGAVSAVN